MERDKPEKSWSLLPWSQAVLAWLQIICYSADTRVLQPCGQKWLAGTGQPASVDQLQLNCSQSWEMQWRWCHLLTPLSPRECLRWLDLETGVRLKSSLLQVCWTNSAEEPKKEPYFTAVYFTQHPKYLIYYSINRAKKKSQISHLKSYHTVVAAEIAYAPIWHSQVILRVGWSFTAVALNLNTWEWNREEKVIYSTWSPPADSFAPCIQTQRFCMTGQSTC